MPASTPAKRSGNPAVRASAAPTKVTSVSEWKQATQGDKITLPSGKVAKIARIELTTLIAEKLLGDSYTALAMKAANNGDPAEAQQAIADMGSSEGKILESLDVFDKVTARCFIEPPVSYYKGAYDSTQVIPQRDRDPEELYSDEIALEDKIFVFQLISGGSADVERFRAEFSQSLGGISAGQGVALPS